MTDEFLTDHPLSEADARAMREMRETLATMPQPQADLAAQRAGIDARLEQVPAATNVRYEPGTVAGIGGWWCVPAGDDASVVVLYLHGGAYRVGSAYAFRHAAGQLAARAGCAAFVPDYRLAPEHPYPAALDDGLATYRALATSGRRAVVLAGDSAGGGLALAVAQRVAADADPAVMRPAAIVALSPWTDLALAGESVASRAAVDPLLTRERLAAAAASYAGAHDPREPGMSPLYGAFDGLPPTTIHVGDAEILLDDSVRVARAMRAAGSPVEAHVWDGMPHVFTSLVATLEAARAALDEIGAFLRRVLPASAA